MAGSTAGDYGLLCGIPVIRGRFSTLSGFYEAMADAITKLMEGLEPEGMTVALYHDEDEEDVVQSFEVLKVEDNEEKKEKERRRRNAPRLRFPSR